MATNDDNATTVRLTVGQAVVKFMEVQKVERDGVTQDFFGGVFGIFGHGNVAGLGQAILQERENFNYYQGRNEQGMVDIAIGYAKIRNRLGALAVTSSTGPGANNMVTGAGTATSNRIPVLILPSDVFATRRTGSVLQQIEYEHSNDVSANDSFKAVSRYWDRISRPEQLPSALLNAMRVLTSPADTGAVTLALPQDVQAEAYDFPVSLFKERVWHIPRQRADKAALARAVELLRTAEKPVIIAGGGVIYSEASEALAAFAESTGIPVGATQSGKASLPYEHPQFLGALGTSGSEFANKFAKDADVVIGVGTRYTDFTSASNTMFQNPDVKFININVFEFDAFKEAATPLVGDARATLEELLEQLDGWSVEADFRRDAIDSAQAWRDEIVNQIAPTEGTLMGQAEAIGIVNEFAGPNDVVINAAGSMPGELHRIWKSGSPLGYGIEYGYSCMGYEIPGAVGTKLGDPSREVFCFIGDGSYLMYHQDILTAVQEGIKVTILIVDNEGFGSINALSETLGSQGFGTRFQYRTANGQLDGDRIKVDFVANARSYGADAIGVETPGQLRDALRAAAASTTTTVIYIPVQAQGRFGGSGAWWEVPVAQIAELDSTKQAEVVYAENRKDQKLYL